MEIREENRLGELRLAMQCHGVGFNWTPESLPTIYLNITKNLCISLINLRNPLTCWHGRTNHLEDCAEVLGENRKKSGFLFRKESYFSRTHWSMTSVDYSNVRPVCGLGSDLLYRINHASRILVSVTRSLSAERCVTPSRVGESRSH